MDEEAQKIIAEQLKTLPNDVKEAIVSVDYKTKLQEITQRQKLLIDQAGKLEMETTLVMIGLEPLADYIANLQRELGVTVIRAKEIALDVSENIFKPIRLSLKAMNEANEIKTGPTTDTNDYHGWGNAQDTDLDRGKILNEIENPIPNRPTPPTEKTPAINTAVEVRPKLELGTVPGQEVQELDTLTAKMTGPTVSSAQIIEAKPETKLPEIKSRPTSGIDPYREAIS